YFELNYFKQLLNSPDYNASILIAIKDGKIAAGAVFTVTQRFMQYHLAGTAASYIYDTPMKLILDEARLKANELQLDFLHLGGGVGGSDEDSLFRFKSGFSKLFSQFRTWQYIVNPSVYQELVNSNGILESDFFPLYGAPKK
ncbi:MAG: GNAT family N-acetyltransferase, partial [Flavobacteriaceae bacterium]|nr:GNAT family N-acetyltransferase [Flavobacteriaceae bacterium]